MNRFFKSTIKRIMISVPIFRHHLRTKFYNTKHKIKLKKYINFILSRDKNLYWEVDKRSEVTGYRNILIGISDAPGIYVPGCYLQGRYGIIFGGYNYFAPNTCIVSNNHDSYNTRNSIVEKPILIGAYNWFGFGSVVLPGIQIGDHVTIGANSVVTKDVPSYSIVVGNPAQIIKTIDSTKVVKYVDKYEYYGYFEKDSRKGKLLQMRRRLLLENYEKSYGKIISEVLKREVL